MKRVAIIISIILLLPVAFVILSITQSKLRSLPLVLRPVNGRIEFYGRILDQNGSPVEGVKILTEIGKERFNPIRLISPWGGGTIIKKIELTSAANGDFSISGYWGTAFVIQEFNKSGFISEPSFRRGFSFGKMADYFPDRKKPVIFYMWKKIGPEPLLNLRLNVGVRTNLKEHWINIFAVGQLPDRLMDYPDLIVDQIQNSGWHFDPEQPYRKHVWKWHCRIRMPEGGLIECRDVLPFEAPAEGYQAELEFGCDDPTNPNCDMGANIMGHLFYLKARNGAVYGRVRMEVIPSTDSNGPISFNLSTILNPNGSRNLEPGTGLNDEEIGRSDQKTRTRY